MSAMSPALAKVAADTAARMRACFTAAPNSIPARLKPRAHLAQQESTHDQ
jgi:hypothetical protein